LKYLKTDAVSGAESADDAKVSSELLESQIQALEQELAALGEGDLAGRLRRMLDIGYALVDLKRLEEAWERGWQSFQLSLEGARWEEAIQALDILYKGEQKDSIKALAHAIWLSVTYPVDPELSVAMLEHLIEETPPKADGAAVAAAVARYVVDLRATGRVREDLVFFTGQLLGDVARRHSGVDSQDLFEFWVERMQLDDPAKILPRLAQVLDVLVVDEWWFDRDKLRESLPLE